MSLQRQYLFIAPIDPIPLRNCRTFAATFVTPEPQAFAEEMQILCCVDGHARGDSLRITARILFKGEVISQEHSVGGIKTVDTNAIERAIEGSAMALFKQLKTLRENLFLRPSG